MAGTATFICPGRASGGIVLPVTLVLLLVLAISSTSTLHVTRRAGYSSSGYLAHLESFYRAERALRATESALSDLIFHCFGSMNQCPDQKSWVTVSGPLGSEAGKTNNRSTWKTHPDSNAENGSIEYVVKLIDQGSFRDAPDQLFNIYQISIRAGGPGFAAYSILASTIALCVPNETVEQPICNAGGLRGNWTISLP